MKKLEKTFDKFWWVLAICLLIPASWALFIPGYFGASDDLHIAWLFEMHKTILMGKIPPRFVPDLSFGFGYPLFNFVFPLPFYLAEIFHLGGVSLVDSIKLVFFLSIPFSFLSMFFLLRQFSSRALSFAGAVLYVYTPYRAVDLYIRGAIGEIVSFIFLPLILLSVIKINELKSWKWTGIGALSTAALVLSHNITAYMFMFFISFYLMLQFFVSKDKKTFFIKSTSMIFLSLLISVYFWLPAIVESQLLKYDTVFNFVDHFPTLIQLVKPYWGYGASVAGPYDGMSFFLGIANLLLLVFGLILTFTSWLKFSKEVKILLVWIFASFTITLFLMNYRSTFIWNTLPLLPYFQFPWRFLMMTTFLIPLLILTLEKVKFQKIVAIFITILALVTSGSYFRPEDFLGRLDSYYLNRYIPTPTASADYFNTQEEYLRLPKETKIRPDKNYPLVSFEKGEIISIEKINDLDAIVTLDAKEDTILNYNKYLFPGWTAKIDGQLINIKSGNPFGQLALSIPKGVHNATIKFEETNYRRTLNAISLISFLVSLGLIKNFWPQFVRLYKK